MTDPITGRTWTVAELRRFVADRLTEPIRPARVWRPGVSADVVAAEAEGVELPTEAGARVAP